MTNYTQWKSLVDLQEYSALPDSVVSDWEFSEGSGTTVADSVGDWDADFNDISWGSDDGIDETYGILDGSSDFAEFNGSKSDKDFAHWREDGEGAFIGFLKFESVSSRMVVWGTSERGDVEVTTGLGSNDDPQFSIHDSENGVSVQDSFSNFGADTWQVFAGSAHGPDNNLNFYGTNSALDWDLETIGTASIPSDFGSTDDYQYDFAIGRDQDDGGRRYYGGGVSAFRHFDSPRTESELQQRVNELSELFD